MKTQSMFSFGLCLFGFVFIGLVRDAKITEKDIIAQWSFDESAADDVAIDMSGNGHDGTFDLGAKKTGAKFGSGAALDGKKGQVITIQDHADLNVTDQLSIVAWVKWNKGGIVHGEPRQWPMIVSKIPINQAYLLFLDTGDGGNANKPSIAFRMKGPGTVYSKVTVTDETWYHAAGTYDGKSVKIYIDGTLSNELKAGGPIATTNDVLTIGAGKGATGNRFDGSIDEVGIYNRALTPEEVVETMEGFFAVNPMDKVAVVWGLLKSQGRLSVKFKSEDD